jgi:hypothetical protein
MLKYFPFGETFEAGMGGHALRQGESLIDIDIPHYAYEVRLKRQMLETSLSEYYCGGADLLQAQWVVLERILDDLATSYPQFFILERSGQTVYWKNTLLNEDYTFHLGDVTSLPQEPLDWVGRQVQEDLVLVTADAQASFVGGQLCFPNGWDIPDRIGKSFMTIHTRTPETTMPSVHAGVRLLSTMKPGKTIWRMSWNFKLTDQLDLSTRYKPQYKADFAARAPQLTPETAAQEIFIRIERQTFTRLRNDKHVLFGIHTYNSRLADEAADPVRAKKILNVLRGTPEDVKRYKAITPIEAVMLTFLETRIN